MQTAFALFYLVMSATVPVPQSSCAQPTLETGACRSLWGHATQQQPAADKAATAKGESDLRVVATGSEGTVLVARLTGPDSLVAELQDAGGKVKERLAITTPWASAGRDLAQLAEVSDFITKHNLVPVVAGEVDPTGSYVVEVKLGAKESEATLVGVKGRTSLSKWPSRNIVVRVYWTQSGEAGFLAGKVSNRGFLVSFNVPTQGRVKFASKDLEALLLENAQHHLEQRRSLRASRLAGMALNLKESVGGLYIKCVADAWLRRYEESAKALVALRKKSAEGAKEALAKAWAVNVVRESYYRTLDFSAEDVTYKASKGFEGTSVWVKIKDAGGTTLGVFKPTNGNTYHRGEIFTYQMAKLLRTEEMYPVNILLELDKAGCEKFNEALAAVKYKGMKERNRKKLMEVCKKQGALEGTFKEWISGFVFLGMIGTQEKLKKTAIYRTLDKKGPYPDREKYLKVKQITALYKPDECKEATYFGRLNERKLAQDLSDMLVMDALNANEDRFPGANIEFKAMGPVREIKKCMFDFGESRLFSLDNGATFKGSGSNALQDLTKRLVITRFSKRTVARLKLISEFIQGTRQAPKFLRRHGVYTVEQLWSYLALDKGDSHKRRKQPYKLFEATLRAVLKHINSVSDRRSWF